MKVTLLIVLVDEGYRVRVIETGPPTRTWLRVYASKQLCMSELHHFNLMSTDEAANALLGEFEKNQDMLAMQVKTDQDTLEAAGFEFLPMRRVS